MILACDACASSRNDEKSEVRNGWRALPSTLPPFASTTASTSRSSVCPKTSSVVRKNQVWPPELTTALAVPFASAHVSYVECMVLGEQNSPVRPDAPPEETSNALTLSRAI